ILNAVGNHRGSETFTALRGVANAKQDVFFTSSVAQHFEYIHGSVRAGRYTPTDGNRGQTVPSALSGMTETFASVNPNLDAREAAITTAHELSIHVLRFFQGLPYKHGEIPWGLTQSIEEEAAQNYDARP